MARLLKEPSILPISIALTVPAACDALPIAKPRDIGFFNFIHLHNLSLTDAPSIPVIITADTVNDITPPSFRVIPIANAVVTDIETNERAIISDNPSNITTKHTDTTDAITPTNIANNIVQICFLSNGNWRYIGTAKHTVTGTKKYVKYFAPELYDSYGILNPNKINITNTVAKNSGVVNGFGHFLFIKTANINDAIVIAAPKYKEFETISIIFYFYPHDSRKNLRFYRL